MKKLLLFSFSLLFLTACVKDFLQQDETGAGNSNVLTIPLQVEAPVEILTRAVDLPNETLISSLDVFVFQFPTNRTDPNYGKLLSYQSYQNLNDGTKAVTIDKATVPEADNVRICMVANMTDRNVEILGGRDYFKDVKSWNDFYMKYAQIGDQDVRRANGMLMYGDIVITGKVFSTGGTIDTKLKLKRLDAKINIKIKDLTPSYVKLSVVSAKVRQLPRYSTFVPRTIDYQWGCKYIAMYDSDAWDKSGSKKQAAAFDFLLLKDSISTKAVTSQGIPTFFVGDGMLAYDDGVGGIRAYYNDSGPTTAPSTDMLLPKRYESLINSVYPDYLRFDTEHNLDIKINNGEILESGRPVNETSFYMFETSQDTRAYRVDEKNMDDRKNSTGEILNTDARLKPSTEYLRAAKFYTYVELLCTYYDPVTVTSTTFTLKIYLGADNSSNFNIDRNKSYVYNVIIRSLADIKLEEDKRITSKEGAKIEITDRESARSENIYTIDAHNEDELKFTITSPSAGKAFVEVLTTDDKPVEGTSWLEMSNKPGAYVAGNMTKEIRDITFSKAGSQDIYLYATENVLNGGEDKRNLKVRVRFLDDLLGKDEALVTAPYNEIIISQRAPITVGRFGGDYVALSSTEWGFNKKLGVEVIEAPYNVKTDYQWTLNLPPIMNNHPYDFAYYNGAKNIPILDAAGGGSPAANVCKKLNRNGKNDWYLPSFVQLAGMMIAQNDIMMKEPVNNRYKEVSYWASNRTSMGSYGGTYVKFSPIWLEGEGTEQSLFKHDNKYRVRCVRDLN